MSLLDFLLIFQLFSFQVSAGDIPRKEKTQMTAKNVLGASLQACSTSPMTGFFRDGFCRTGKQDTGTHVVAAEVTQEFLDFTKSKGNDLSTAAPEYNFPGLKPGDRWCLCALRWKEANEAGKAPPVILEATNERALDFVTFEDLRKKQKK